MDILICQACGSILRGKGKFCTGCGLHFSKFSPTALPIVSQSSGPLAVTLAPNPTILERALSEREVSQLGNGNGNGNGGGNGGNGGGQYAPTNSGAPSAQTMTPWTGATNSTGNTPIPRPPAQPQPAPQPAPPAQPPAPAQPAGQVPAEPPKPASKLGSALAGASSATPFAKPQAPTFLSFDEDDPVSNPSPQPAAPAAAPQPAAQAPVLSQQATFGASGGYSAVQPVAQQPAPQPAPQPVQPAPPQPIPTPQSFAQPVTTQAKPISVGQALQPGPELLQPAQVAAPVADPFVPPAPPPGMLGNPPDMPRPVEPAPAPQPVAPEPVPQPESRPLAPATPLAAGGGPVTFTGRTTGNWLKANTPALDAALAGSPESTVSETPAAPESPTPLPVPEPTPVSNQAVPSSWLSAPGSADPALAAPAEPAAEQPAAGQVSPSAAAAAAAGFGLGTAAGFNLGATTGGGFNLGPAPAATGPGFDLGPAPAPNGPGFDLGPAPAATGPGFDLGPAPAEPAPPATPEVPPTPASPTVPAASATGNIAFSQGWTPPAEAPAAPAPAPATPADPAAPAALAWSDTVPGSPPAAPPATPLAAVFAPETTPAIPAEQLPAATPEPVVAAAPPDAVPQQDSGGLPAFIPAEQPAGEFTPFGSPIADPAAAAGGGMDFFSAPAPEATPTPADVGAALTPDIIGGSPLAQAAPTPADLFSVDGGLFGAAPAADPGGLFGATAQAAPPPQQDFAAAPAPQAAPAGLDFFSSAGPASPAAAAAAAPAPAPAASAPAPAPAPAASAGLDDFFAPVAGAATASGAMDFMFNSPGQDIQASPQLATGGHTSVAPAETSTAAAAVDDQGFPDESVKRGRGKETSERSLRRSMRDREEEKEEEKPEPANQVQAILAMLEGNIDIAGQSIPKKAAAIGALVALVIGWNVLGMMLGAVTGAAKQAQTPKLPSIAGEYELAYVFAGKEIHGQFIMDQDKNKLGGEGQDPNYFIMSGQFVPPKIEFNKQYLNPQTNEKIGKPILFSGEVKMNNGVPYMSGIYVAQIKKGNFYNTRWIEVRNNWEAGLTKPGTDTGKDLSQVEVKKSGPKEFQDMLSKFAIGLLFVGFLIVLASLKLFGPSGLINIWAKKEYIPSQFKTQHAKMLRELGKPPKPGGMPIGKREDWNMMKVGQPQELALTPAMRDSNPHVLIIGAGAKGKSRLIAKMISHDIECNERAVVLIDSDGNLADIVLRWVSSHPKGKQMAERITVIDPTNKAGCKGYNPLESPDDGDLQAAASAVVFGFKAIYMEPPGSQSQWNQQTANILRNAALLLMANDKTLVDLPTLLSDNDFRDILLEKIEKKKGEKVEYITLLDTWSQYKKLARTDQWITWVEPILNRVGPMLSDPRIRPILTKPSSDLKLRQIIENGDVLIVKIPQGQLDQNANLLGSLLVTGVKQAALSIANTKSKRHPCALYLDEFDNFIEKETFEAITSETRKFQIGLVAAIKTLQHLPEDYRNQLVINSGTAMVFALAKKDGDMLGPQMFRVDGRKVKHQTISNIFNRVNTSPQFELISDEEKLNIDRVVGQEVRTFFCYRVGTVAGVFHMRSHDFNDIEDKEINWTIWDDLHEGPEKD